MSTRSTVLTDTLYEYYIKVTVRESDAHRRLREVTAKMPESMMQIAPEQGQFMALLVKMIGVRRAFEAGTFTGYSALRIAEALPDDGVLIACDVNEQWTSIGQRHWQEAGVADKIDLRLGHALETLQSLLNEGAAGSFDLGFIDADKTSYSRYYELGLDLLRAGGVLLFDNVLWHGKVADPQHTDADTEAIRAINKRVFNDQRVDASMLPIGDGLTIARKR